MADIYEPLDESLKQIRLLHINPGPHEETPSCTTTTVSLDDNIDYEALSYVWGDVGDTVPIIFYDRPFKVTRNLASALRYLRYPDRERTIWIDALCINQNDVHEKNSQVPRMNLLYSKATRVVIFLGEMDEDGAIAANFFQTINSHPDLHLDASKDPHLDLSGLKWGDRRMTTAIASFFDRPWWHRIWTVQEFILAKKFTIQLGQQIIDQQMIVDFEANFNKHTKGCCYGVFRSLLNNDQTNFRTMCYGLENLTDWAAMHKNRERILFTQILLRYKGRNCYDPRDYIYGMLGLAADDIVKLIKPDYRDSSPAEKVFEATALAIIEHYENLDLLSLKTDEAENKVSLPSWIPNWSIKEDVVIYNARVVRNGVMLQYDACGGRKAALSPISTGVCSTPALILDRIKTIGEPSTFIQPVPPSWANVAQAFGDERYMRKKSSRWVAFMMTVCGGAPILRPPYLLRCSDEEADVAMMTDWLAHKSEGLDPRSMAYANAVGCSVTGRRFFISEKRYIGLAPSASKEGDIIAVLPGARVPYVLRAASREKEPGKIEEEQSSCYMFVGDAYVHGLMDGEAFSSAEEEGNSISDIILV